MAYPFILTSLDPDEFKILIADLFSQSIKHELSFSIKATEIRTILTRQETADLLNISLPTLHDYTKRGLIKAYRLGNKVRYKLNEIESSLILIKTSKK